MFCMPQARIKNCKPLLPGRLEFIGAAGHWCVPEKAREEEEEETVGVGLVGAFIRQAQQFTANKVVQLSCISSGSNAGNLR